MGLSVGYFGIEPIFLILLIFQITVYENHPKDDPCFAGVGKLLFSVFLKKGVIWTCQAAIFEI